MKDKMRESCIYSLGCDSCGGVFESYVAFPSPQICPECPKAGEDGLLSDDEIRKLRKPVPQGIELIDSGDLFIDYRDIAKAQKALDDKRWIEGIEKIAEIRFELEEHGKIVDKLYQFTDRSWQELKTEEK